MHKRIAAADAAPESKRPRRGRMGKELTAEQKAIVKMYVTRGVTEGLVKCSHCDKEISSRNVDRWASHLRGCARTPEDVKAQIQPVRAADAAVVTKSEDPVTAAAVPAAVATPVTHVPHTPNPLGNGYNEVFKVHVSKDYMKFNAAHFIAYKVRAASTAGRGMGSNWVVWVLQGFREKLHGHNYRLAVTITGQVGPDGYVVDFGEIKKISRVICKELNESFLVPMNSDALKVCTSRTGELVAMG
ncbi:unnamed protein product [Phytophthora fragariaefolia]|uniref:6-pyruvoyltetrahydropterin synthase n=1 Tax=Phytophthora fragariaefolia TaxID=1490495 RepID=A0A9W6XP20_9STRA|nr:unnamed protein product [Phytophthora fragariaefolia]